MTAWVGNFTTGVTVRWMYGTNAADGSAITMATNGTVQVYKNGGTTQSTSGVTVTEDFDSLTGIHLVAIDTSSDGTFYSAGADFIVVLQGATIDGKSVNVPLFGFSIENRMAGALTTSERTSIAQAVLSEPLDNVESTISTAGRKALGWLLALVFNTSTLSGGTVTVKKTDGTTTMFTQAVTQTAGVDPITSKSEAS